MSAYARINDAPHFAAFSDIRTGVVGPMERAHNYQLGYKYQSDMIYADLSAYYRTFTGVPFSNRVTFNGTTELGLFAYGSETKGLEYAFTLKPFNETKYLDGFTLSASGDYAYGNYNKSDGCISFFGQVNTTICKPSFNLQGYLLARQPIFQTRVTPAYTLPTDWGFVKGWVTFEYVGRHYGDQFEQQDLGTYYDMAFGVTGEVGRHWEWTLVGTNVTDQIGLTEGNARILGAATTGGTIQARSIEGREVSLQVKYKL